MLVCCQFKHRWNNNCVPVTKESGHRGFNTNRRERGRICETSLSAFVSCRWYKRLMTGENRSMGRSVHASLPSDLLLFGQPGSCNLTALCQSPTKSTTGPNWPIKLAGWPSPVSGLMIEGCWEKNYSVLWLPGSGLASRQPRFVAKHLDLGLHAIPPPVFLLNPAKFDWLGSCGLVPYPKATNHKLSVLINEDSASKMSKVGS